jgi:hypothetical protein
VDQANRLASLPLQAILPLLRLMASAPDQLSLHVIQVSFSHSRCSVAWLVEQEETQVFE